MVASETLQDQTGNQSFAVYAEKCLGLHERFLKLVGGVWLAMVRFLCCYILFKNLWLIKHTSIITRKPFRIYSFLQKIRVYEILLIPPKFAKFLEMCYRGKLQCLQGTTSYEGTTKLRKLTINWGHDWFFYFHKLGWSGNIWKYLGAWYVGSFIPPSRDEMF